MPTFSLLSSPLCCVSSQFSNLCASAMCISETLSSTRWKRGAYSWTRWMFSSLTRRRLCRCRLSALFWAAATFTWEVSYALQHVTNQLHWSPQMLGFVWSSIFGTTKFDGDHTKTFVLKTFFYYCCFATFTCFPSKKEKSNANALSVVQQKRIPTLRCLQRCYNCAVMAWKTGKSGGMEFEMWLHQERQKKKGQKETESKTVERQGFWAAWLKAWRSIWVVLLCSVVCRRRSWHCHREPISPTLLERPRGPHAKKEPLFWNVLAERSQVRKSAVWLWCEMRTRCVRRASPQHQIIKASLRLRNCKDGEFSCLRTRPQSPQSQVWTCKSINRRDLHIGDVSWTVLQTQNHMANNV